MGYGKEKGGGTDWSKKTERPLYSPTPDHPQRAYKKGLKKTKGLGSGQTKSEGAREDLPQLQVPGTAGDTEVGSRGNS